MVVRLTATEPSLLAHLAQREIGSGADEQAQRLPSASGRKGLDQGVNLAGHK
jgi:hypothetical protein